mgnify:CR=1 FL=1
MLTRYNFVRKVVIDLLNIHTTTKATAGVRSTFSHFKTELIKNNTTILIFLHIIENSPNYNYQRE